MCERVKKMMDSKYFTLNTSLQIIIIVFYLPVNMIFFLYLVNNNTSDIFTGFQKSMFYVARLCSTPSRAITSVPEDTATWKFSGKAWRFHLSVSRQVCREIS